MLIFSASARHSLTEPVQTCTEARTKTPGEFWCCAMLRFLLDDLARISRTIAMNSEITAENHGASVSRLLFCFLVFFSISIGGVFSKDSGWIHENKIKGVIREWAKEYYVPYRIRCRYFENNPHKMEVKVDFKLLPPQYRPPVFRRSTKVWQQIYINRGYQSTGRPGQRRHTDFAKSPITGFWSRCTIPTPFFSE